MKQKVFAYVYSPPGKYRFFILTEQLLELLTTKCFLKYCVCLKGNVNMLNFFKMYM